MNVNLKVKLLTPNAVIPSYSRIGDAALDLTATSKDYDLDNGCVIFGTGIATEIPEGFVGLLFPRSSVFKTPLVLANSIGVIDSNYRGEIKAIFKTLDRPKRNYEVGDRVAQLVVLPIPTLSITTVDALSETNRGQEGFGSSGL